MLNTYYSSTFYPNIAVFERDGWAFSVADDSRYTLMMHKGTNVIYLAKTNVDQHVFQFYDPCGSMRTILGHVGLKLTEDEARKWISEST